jgi:MinD superfamily P-loop ATPase
MKLAILSGKGGTGKTTVSVNLFSYLDDYTLIDTDIEEPNSHLFLNYHPDKTIDIKKGYPIVDQNKCTLCGKCETHCNFNAIITTKKNVMVFDDLCHDCGMCKLVCDANAIHYHQKSLGTIIYSSLDDGKNFMYGKLNTGEVSGVKLIESLKEANKDTKNYIIDCPPGVACNTSLSVDGVDHAIIVTEPSPFGLSDMKMVVELLRKKHIPFGVVINKAGLGQFDIKFYLKTENIKHYGDIRYSKLRAELYSKGNLLIETDSTYQKELDFIITNLLRDVGDKHA